MFTHKDYEWQIGTEYFCCSCIHTYSHQTLPLIPLNAFWWITLYLYMWETKFRMKKSLKVSKCWNRKILLIFSNLFSLFVEICLIYFLPRICSASGCKEIRICVIQFSDLFLSFHRCHEFKGKISTPLNRWSSL